MNAARVAKGKALAEAWKPKAPLSLADGRK